jgi:hypothetical protein
MTGRTLLIGGALAILGIATLSSALYSVSESPSGRPSPIRGCT